MVLLPSEYNLTNIQQIYTNTRSILYRAVWKNNVVAVKHIPKRFYTMNMDKVITEVNVLQQLQNSKHVVRYIDTIEHDHDIYIIMEWINGLNIKEFIQQIGRPVSEQKVKEIIFPLVETLKICHELNLIYGDVKPENIMIEPSGLVKIIDFGCTRPIGTVKNTYLGTPLYFSPEMFYQVCLPQYDVWGIGIIIYYLASGQHPFVRTSPVDMTDLKNMVYHTPLQFDHPAWADWTEEGIYLLLQLLEKDSFRRLNISTVYNHKWFDSAKCIMDE